MTEYITLQKEEKGREKIKLIGRNQVAVQVDLLWLVFSDNSSRNLWKYNTSYCRTIAVTQPTLIPSPTCPFFPSPFYHFFALKKLINWISANEFRMEKYDQNNVKQNILHPLLAHLNYIYIVYILTKHYLKI